MPHYAFNWTGEAASTEVDLPDEQAAWSQAVTTTGEILRDLDGAFPAPGTFHMEVRDPMGNTVISIHICARRLRPAKSELGAGRN